MRNQSFVFLGLAFLALPLCATASAILSSSCTNDEGDSGFTCNFYESLNGAPSEISDVVPFPAGQSVTAGYIVLLESPAASHTDPTQWSDVLHLIDGGGGLATSAQLLSIGCNCFPTSDTVQASPNAFVVEPQGGAPDNFQFTSGFNTFNIFGGSPVATPEPSSLLLFALGLLIVVRRITLGLNPG